MVLAFQKLKIAKSFIGAKQNLKELVKQGQIKDEGV